LCSLNQEPEKQLCFPWERFNLSTWLSENPKYLF
jgi:hypothetical protein